jgi:hypothetical protein
MRLVFAAVLLGAAGIYPLAGQVCPPTRILPVDHVSGALDDTSCRLADSSRLASYKLDLPARGTIGLTLTSSAFSLTLRDATGAKLSSGSSIARPIEAGSYTVLVNAAGPDDAGTFTLDSTFTAEPGMICSQFPSLGINQTITGRLGVAGCLTPGGVPYDGWSVTTFGSGTLTVSLPQADFGAVLILRDAQGYVLASGTGPITAPVDGDSQYIVVVSTNDQAGGYQLNTTFQPADGETCQALRTFSATDLDTAAISANSCVSTSGDGADLSYFNYYQLTVGSAGLAQITVDSADFLPTIQLLSENGDLLAVDTGSGGDAQSQLKAFLKPGNYLVQVVSSVPTGGYTLHYDFDSSALPQACPPVPATAGGSLAGTLATTSCRTPRGLADLYRLTLPGPGTLLLGVNASAFNGRLAIRDTKENLVVAVGDIQALGYTSFSADFPAGDYLVTVESTFGSGSYQLTSGLLGHVLPGCGSVQALDINGGFIQKLGVNGCRGANGQPFDLYEFVLPTDSVVAAIMTSAQVDGFLSLTNPDGSVLRSDHNSYGPNDPLIVQYLPAGTYRLAARAFSATPGGYYEVDLRNIPGSRPGFCAPRGNLDPGGSVTGTINFAGCEYPDGTFADIYKVVLPQDATVDLGLNSSDFDGYLVLLDAWGSSIDEDDNSGSGTNARITGALAAGTYYVVAKPASGYTSAGAYTLSLTTQQ